MGRDGLGRKRGEMGWIRMGWDGLDWNGMEWDGMEWDGEAWRGMEIECDGIVL